MRYFLLAALCAGPILTGCSPALNWRDVRPPDQTPVIALFPCKPDQGTRVVSLGAKDVAMTMLGCDADGATFTLAYVDMKDIALLAPVLAQWQRATLGNIRAPAASALPFLIQGANVLPPPVQVTVNGLRPDGTAVAARAVWFAAGTLVFQAAVYADTASPARAETYFAGLRLQ